MEDAEKMEVAATHGRQDLLNSNKIHGDNLGGQTDGKYAMEIQNIFDKDVCKTEHNSGRSPQQSIVLPFVNETDQGGITEKEVGASGQNAIPESENKSTAVILNDVTEIDYSHPAADQVQPNETFDDQIGDANSIKMIEEEVTVNPEDQAAFMNELEKFYKEKGTDFPPPRLYGYVSQIMVENRIISQLSQALLEYERHKLQNSKPQLALPSVPEPPAAANVPNGYQTTGSGRATLDAASSPMQGWHAPHRDGYDEIAQPIIKDKSLNNMATCEKKLKTIGSVKTKRPKKVEHPVKAARTETFKQLAPTVFDVGPRADWVKINVREHIDCFEVYALVPGLLREEVKVKSDPKGLLVISGQPEHHDNPWGITAFEKVVSLPARINPLQTSAVVTLHGQLFVRVPFDSSI